MNRSLTPLAIGLCRCVPICLARIRQQTLIHELPPLGTELLGGIVAGRYKHWADLQALEATASGMGPKCFRPATPLDKWAWRQALEHHPHRQFVDYLLAGMQYGFHIGAQRSCIIKAARTGNLPSVQQHPHLVAKHLADEIAAGRILGPLPPHLARLCQISPMGLIPKPHQPGKWRLIVDLSSPRGASVNDAIPPHAVCIGTRGSHYCAQAGERHAAGQDRLAQRISCHPSAPRRSPTACCQVGPGHLH